MEECYYKIMLKDKKLSVVCLQWFDEKDYDEDNWLIANKFNSEEEAKVAVACARAYLSAIALGMFTAGEIE